MSKTVNVYKPMLPTEGENGEIEHTDITAVLTQGAGGQYAVYLGIGSEEFVKGYGRKLTYKHALQYYPGLKKEDYRR